MSSATHPAASHHFHGRIISFPIACNPNIIAAARQDTGQCHTDAELSRAPPIPHQQGLISQVYHSHVMECKQNVVRLCKASEWQPATSKSESVDRVMSVLLLKRRTFHDSGC